MSDNLKRLISFEGFLWGTVTVMEDVDLDTQFKL